MDEGCSAAKSALGPAIFRNPARVRWIASIAAIGSELTMLGLFEPGRWATTNLIWVAPACTILGLLCGFGSMAGIKRYGRKGMRNSRMSASELTRVLSLPTGPDLTPNRFPRLAPWAVFWRRSAAALCTLAAGWR